MRTGMIKVMTLRGRLGVLSKQMSTRPFVHLSIFSPSRALYLFSLATQLDHNRPERLSLRRNYGGLGLSATTFGWLACLF